MGDFSLVSNIHSTNSPPEIDFCQSIDYYPFVTMMTNTMGNGMKQQMTGEMGWDGEGIN